MATIYALAYERPPQSVDGDLAQLPAAEGVTVLTSSAFRLVEARRTDREMRGPFASLEAALRALEPAGSASPHEERAATLLG